MRRTYKFKPIRVRTVLGELLEIPIFHPLRHHHKLELRSVLRNSQKWNHVRMFESPPGYDLLVKPLHRWR